MDRIWVRFLKGFIIGFIYLLLFGGLIFLVAKVSTL